MDSPLSFAFYYFWGGLALIGAATVFALVWSYFFW
jgi:hypothetical protein